MRKIAVVFQGVGYIKDRPLLYYSGKQTVSFDDALVWTDFLGMGWSKEALKNPHPEGNHRNCVNVTSPFHKMKKDDDGKGSALC